MGDKACIKIKSVSFKERAQQMLTESSKYLLFCLLGTPLPSTGTYIFPFFNRVFCLGVAF